MLRMLSLLTFTLLSTMTYASQGSVVGRVMSIADDNDGILVRIGDGKNAETYKLCGDLNVIQDAFSHGEVVKASFNDPIDRCLSQVEIQKDVQPAKAEPPKKEKPRAVSKAEGSRKPSSIY